MKSVSVFSYGTPEHALGHLRFCAPLKRCGIQVNWHNPTDDFLPDSDLVIIQRDFPRNLKRYSDIVYQANLHQKPILFEIDDLLWELPPDHPDRINSHYLDALWPMILAAQQSDAVIVATPKLRGFLQQLNSNVFLLPNYFDDNLWEFRTPVQENGVVRIGYMGGASHGPDIQMILPALKVILRNFPAKVKIVFWGLEPPEDIRTMSNVDWFPLDTQNYAEFADYFLQQNIEIFLAPLRQSIFNQCKSPIKYFECTALGSVGVCSDIEPYRQVIQHGETGYLANSIDDWITCLSAVIENSQLRNRISLNAKKNIQQNWLLSQNYLEWADIYQSVIDQYQPRDQEKIFKIATSIESQWYRASQFEHDHIASSISTLENRKISRKSNLIRHIKQFYRKWRNLLLRG